MSSNPPPSPTPHNSSKQSATWFSNILRPRASSISVEACLNLSSRDPSQPLDSRPILPLLETNQPLASRCKHLQAFSDICKNYRFTHLENVFFTVQDILEYSMPQEARHTVFEFMLACIEGQYTDLGMARVTFYALLRSYTVWDDFGDMYKILFTLCKGGRDISGFEKNVCKLLIHWLEMAIEHQPQPSQQTIPYLSDILHLLTVICKFNFALFEDDEVTQMLLAVHQAFFSSHHTTDRQACLEFTDIVVRYRFVPFEALVPFLDMLASSVVLLPPPSKTTKPTITCWPIYQNLLRSHCAHSAILTMCRFIDQEPSKKKENVLIKGAMRLLSETAWGKNKTGVEAYMLSDSVILMYLKRAASKGTDATHGTILECLITLVETEDNDLGLMEWEAVWDIVDLVVRYILKMTDNNSNYDVDLFNLTSDSSQCILQFSRFSQLVIRLRKDKLYAGPVIRLMQVLYELRGYCDDATAQLLLDYYVTEHFLLPSTENWLTLLQELTNMFFIHTNPNTTTSVTRLLMLQIVSDVCASVKDFYSEDMYENIVIPMMQTLPKETDHEIRQLAIDLIVSSLSDCQNESIFERLVSILGLCTTCHCVTTENVQQKTRSHPPSLHPHRSQANTTSNFIMDTASDAFFKSQTECTGVSATLGLSEVFENLLLASNGRFCQRTFAVLTEIANKPSDLSCPFGGSRIVALDLFLRLRCPTNHHIYLIEDTIQEENSVIAFIRSQQQIKQRQAELKRSQDNFMSGPAIKTNTTTTPAKKPVFYPNASILSYSEKPEEDMVLAIDDMLQSYIQVLSDSPNWVVVLFVLKRMPQQLSNKHLFCGASPAVNKLRRLLVRWTSTRKFLENVVNIPSQIKRNDLTVYAYNLLTVLISYRRIFTEPKQDQDEIVYAFYVGIMQVTSATRLCINSLAVCCHEMPLSVTKMLNEILQRMSQIISVSSVSVHILEFLSALARLPNLYANFTGDMYKPVFAIALNYLQHSRSQQQQSSPLSTPSASPLMTSGSNNSTSNIGHNVASPTLSMSGAQNDISQGALKQYVLIMAYLVITVWFTAIPLRERRKHVPFIVQRLLSGISLGKPIDEQTYTCIDMLSRFTFADVGLSPEKSIVSKILMGDGEQNASSTNPSSKQDQRTWVYGHTLLTLRTAKSLGWVEVTIRRPSGTVSMMCHVENKIKSDEIDYRTLPALLMMQYQPNLIAHQILKDREEIQQESSYDSVKEQQDEYLEQEEEEGLSKVEPEQEGSALGITFDDDGKQRFPTGTPTRRPSDQAVVSATVATRSEGLVMAPSAGPPPASPAVTIHSTASMSPGLARRPSLSQKGLIEILNKTSSEATHDIKSPSLLPHTRSEEETGPKQAEAAAHASVHEIMSEPKRLPSMDASVHPLAQQLRKIEPSIDPSFLYLQFNNYPDMARAMDISPPLPNDDSTARTLATFDRIPVVDFHKIGVLYVGKGQTHEVEILANTYGSPDYVRFLNALGTIQQLRGRTGNSGGLDREMDIDGPFAYFWKDDVTEAVFHVATLMPTDLTRDPQCSAKKRHIGNDYVSIVYNDSGMDYAFDTLPSQFNFINIVVSPHSISTEAVSPTHAMNGAENTFFKVEMQKRPDMPDIGPMGEPKLVSAQSLPGFVRGAALHANIFAQVFWQSVGTGGKREYVSHWRERLRQILRVKERLASKSNTATIHTPNTNEIGTPGKMGKDGYPYEALLDFTKYT
ncbi:hypothetical protein BD560DRAFT_447904 [Blakeslea trispora]|nr:hypothetical protein BD560DRAFT_447904 [Blakeslea trispora]